MRFSSLFDFSRLRSSTSILEDKCKIFRIALILLILVRDEQVFGNSVPVLADSENSDADVGNTDSTNLETLQLVQVVFRHGDRTPTGTYPSDPYRNTLQFWPQGLGQLTDIGKLQHYNLGRYFRNRYDGFLNQIYVPHEIFILSSDMDRTIMSAEANLAGLYQPTNSDHNWNPVIPWTPIPIRTIPKMEDKYLRSAKICSKYPQLFDEMMASETIQSFNRKHAEFIEYIKTHTGIDGDTLEDIISVEDVLTVDKFHHYPLPAWANKVLHKFHQLAAETLLWNTLTPEMKRLKGGPLLKMLIQNMKFHIINGHRNKLHNQYQDINVEDEFLIGKANKLYMYSAHDSTLMRLMDTLGVFDPIMVPYASALMIELHRIDFELVVKIFFRNETSHPPYQLEVPGCSKMCPFDTFVELTKPVVPTDWELECENDDDLQLRGVGTTALSKPKAPTSTWSKLYVLGEAGLFVTCLLILIILILYASRHRLSHPIISISYPYIKSRNNNYGSNYVPI